MEQLLRKDIEKHKKECPRRQHKCPHCKEAGEYQERTTTHLDECPMIEVPCPKRECKENILRRNISDHLQECMFEEVPCKYTNIGCGEKVLRRDIKELQEHEIDGQWHLQLAIDAVHQQQVTISNMLNITQVESIKKKPLPPTKFMYKMTNFNHHKTIDDEVYSPGFYTSTGGYKVCIRVYANGPVRGRQGTHVSVHVYLMKGKNDDHLPWPFTGTVTSELLNQLEDNNHSTKSVTFPSERMASQQVVNQERAEHGYGCSYYISHSDLGYNEAKNCQYLKDDCLYFRITINAENTTKPWLIVV